MYNGKLTKLTKINPDTGEYIYNQQSNQKGEGFFDFVKSVGNTLTSKAAKKIAKKQHRKAQKK